MRAYNYQNEDQSNSLFFGWKIRFQRNVIRFNFLKFYLNLLVGLILFSWTILQSGLKAHTSCFRILLFKHSFLILYSDYNDLIRSQRILIFQPLFLLSCVAPFFMFLNSAFLIFFILLLLNLCLSRINIPLDISLIRCSILLIFHHIY